MEGYYVVFDRANRRVGFAQTTCAQRNSQYISTINGPYETNSTFSRSLFNFITNGQRNWGEGNVFYFHLGVCLSIRALVGICGPMSFPGAGYLCPRSLLRREGMSGGWVSPGDGYPPPLLLTPSGLVGCALVLKEAGF